jgi:hypothetical protein
MSQVYNNGPLRASPNAEERWNSEKDEASVLTTGFVPRKKNEQGTNREAFGIEDC